MANAGASRVSGSFRDPSGFLFRRQGEVYRQVNPVFREHYELMMGCGFYEAAVDRGLLLPHEEVDVPPASSDAYKILKPTQLSFISHPYEWSFSQLKDAALTTLRLEKLALEFGLGLKDASAYNVQFHDGAPIFIDSLSFERYVEGRPWVAYQQFCKHFLAPLAVMTYGHVELAKLLRVFIDGIPLDVASAALPLRTRFRPSLYLHLHLHARLQKKHGDRIENAERVRSQKVSRAGLLGIVDGLESAVRGLRWRPEGTEWGSYYDATNYSATAHDEKSRLVEEFIELADPKVVWDLGANTGRFSRIASGKKIRTIAFDVDPAAVEKNYLEVRERKDRFLLPLVMDLTNPSPDLGWNCEERSSLKKRGPADTVLALALIHHLAISNNVPLGYLADFFAGICRHLVVEFVPKSDSQVQRLLATREDIFPDYTRAGFEETFSNCFEIRRATAIEGSERVLYLMDRREGRTSNG